MGHLASAKQQFRVTESAVDASHGVELGFGVGAVEVNAGDKGVEVVMEVLHRISRFVQMRRALSVEQQRIEIRPAAIRIGRKRPLLLPVERAGVEGSCRLPVPVPAGHPVQLQEQFDQLR